MSRGVRASWLSGPGQALQERRAVRPAGGYSWRWRVGRGREGAAKRGVRVDPGAGGLARVAWGVRDPRGRKDKQCAH